MTVKEEITSIDSNMATARRHLRNNRSKDHLVDRRSVITAVEISVEVVCDAQRARC
jgi:hypothetical protein